MLGEAQGRPPVFTLKYQVINRSKNGSDADQQRLAAGFVKRRDYDVEIAGNTPGAHYMDGYVDVSGIKFPSAQRIFARQNRDPLVVSIDLSNVQLG